MISVESMPLFVTSMKGYEFVMIWRADPINGIDCCLTLPSGMLFSSKPVEIFVVGNSSSDEDIGRLDGCKVTFFSLSLCSLC